jgi:hypothetical protein
MEWISVNERLPDFFQDVLLYDKSKNSIVLGYYSKTYDDKVDRICSSFVVDGVITKDISHWMSLPKNPQ